MTTHDNTSTNTTQDSTNRSQHTRPDKNTPDYTAPDHNTPHYITKSPQHNTKNLPLQVLGTGTSAVTDEKLDEVLVGSTWVERDDVGLRDRAWEDMNEEERSFAREWVMERLMSREGVQMIGAYMDVKGKPAPELWNGLE